VAGEEVGVVGGGAGEGEDFAAARIEGDSGAGFPQEGLLGGLLEMEVEGEGEVAAGAGRDALQGAQGAARGVHLDQVKAIGAAQEVLVLLLEAALADEVAGAVVGGGRGGELAGVNLADEAKHVGADGAVGVAALRHLGEGDAGEIDLLLVEAGEGGGVEVALKEEGFVVRAALVLQQTAEFGGGVVKDIGEQREGRAAPGFGEVGGSDPEGEGGATGGEAVAAAVENPAPGGGEAVGAEAVLAGEAAQIPSLE
jgi:hypothetical protein